MSTTSVFNLTRFTALAAGDVVPVVDISDTAQSAHGSLDSITVTNFFASVPVPIVVTSASASALAVGLAGSTNPVLRVDASAALQATGITITGAAAGAGVAVVARSSGADEALTLNAKGAGTIGIGSVSTGRVTIAPVTTIAGALTLTAQPILSALTAGSVLFLGSSKEITENTSKGPFWDNTNFELRLGDTRSTYNADGEGDGRLIARTQGAEGKIRSGVWGTGYQNWLAFDRARGVIGAPTPIQLGDTFGSVVGVGYAAVGPTWFHGPEMQFRTTENWDATHAGSNIIFFTVPNGTTTQQTAVTIGQDKSLRIFGTAQVGGATASQMLAVQDTSNNNTAQIRSKDLSTSIAFAYLGNFADALYLTVGGTYAGGWASDNINRAIAGVILTSGNADSNIVFTTTATNNAAAATRLTLDKAGNIIPGTAAIATNATDGFLYLPTCAGAPTGVPTAYTGRVAHIYDTTNNFLYIYNGGWKKSTVYA